MRKLFFILCALTPPFATGCSQKVVVPPPAPQPLVVKREVVPVSSVPLDAKVYADGKYIGVTPIAVDLEKNRNHVITIAKDGFVAQNIAIMSKRDPAKSLERTLTSVFENGVASDPLKNAAKSYREEGDTGEAHAFEPSVVTVTLIPEKK
jgi:hypothetical protein